MQTADERLQAQKSPDKAGRTGNVVLDRITREVEQQRDLQQQQSRKEEFKFELESASQDKVHNKEESVVGALGTASADRVNATADEARSLNTPSHAQPPEMSEHISPHLIQYPEHERITSAGNESAKKASVKKINQSTKLDNMLEEGVKDMKKKPIVYKIEGFKTYRNQLGLNIVRNRELAEETSKRSKIFKIQQNEISKQYMSTKPGGHYESTTVDAMSMLDQEASL